MSAAVIDLSTMRAVRRGARFRELPERPAFQAALAALLAGASPLAAYARASECWRHVQAAPAPKGAA